MFISIVKNTRLNNFNPVLCSIFTVIEEEKNDQSFLSFMKIINRLALIYGLTVQ